MPPDPEVIAFLWSREGELWHQKFIKNVRHSTGYFAVVKDDHECGPNGVMCGVLAGSSVYCDEQIIGEIRKYGMSGVPREWKRDQERLNMLHQTL